MDLKRQMMKKTVMAGVLMLFAFTAGAQTFKKGEKVEINKELSDEGDTWTKASVVSVDIESRQYSVRTNDKKLYRIPFTKEDNWIRRPLQPLTTAMKTQDESFTFAPSVDLLKQKIKEQFESDFSEYDSVVVVFENVETLPVYKNTDNEFTRPDNEIHPYKVDITLRLVNKNSDGTQRKINWQFKRKYLLYQNPKGKCSLTVADKEEQILSHI
jgi:hypothetical protein